jgi:hypothetical protein
LIRLIETSHLRGIRLLTTRKSAGKRLKVISGLRRRVRRSGGWRAGGVGFNLLNSQALACAHSRFTVASEMPSAWAASSEVRPPKKRSSTRRPVAHRAETARRALDRPRSGRSWRGGWRRRRPPRPGSPAAPGRASGLSGPSPDRRGSDGERHGQIAGRTTNPGTLLTPGVNAEDIERVGAPVRTARGRTGEPELPVRVLSAFSVEIEGTLEKRGGLSLWFFGIGLHWLLSSIRPLLHSIPTRFRQP